MGRSWMFLILTILTLSCEMVVDVNVPAEKPKLVINSLFNPDSTWSVSVSTSRYILDRSPFGFIPEARVRILDDANNEVSALVFRQDSSSFSTIGRYLSDQKPEVGKKYTIQIEANGETALARGSIPSLIPIARVRVDSSAIPAGGPPYSFDNIPIEITFKDPAEEANYYEVMMLAEVVYSRRLFPSGEIVKDTAWQQMQVRIKDAEFQENPLGNKFTDVRFSGSEHTVFAETFVYRYGYEDMLRFRIVLMHLSEEHFKYASSYIMQQNASYDPFAQPVQVFSNIENGLGIFAGHSRSFVEFRKNE